MEGFLKILLLEDHQSDAELLKAFLLNHKPNCEFRLVMTESAFVNALNDFKPDVILSDNTLPQFSATEALAIFKQRGLHIPFILVTGTVSEEFAAGIIKAGADDYILKDRLGRLPAAIDAALKNKQTEAEKRRAEELLRFKADLLKAVGQAVIATDLNGIVLFWNNAAEQIYGWQSEEAIGKNIVDLTPVEHTRDQAAAIMEDLMKGQSWSGEFMVQRKGGLSFPAFVTNSPFWDEKGNMMGIIGVSYDITNQKQAEDAIRDMERKMAEQLITEQKKISRAIIRGQEAEKNYIGKELHDNINQILAGAKMFLVLAAKKNESVRELVNYPLELLNNSIEEIRRLTYRKVTPLRDIHLKEQLLQLIESLQMNDVLNIRLHYQVQEEQLSDDLKLNLYRIVQEQLNNILKHAAAKSVTIHLSDDITNIELMIRDDGKGFNKNIGRKGIGITNIMNRVASFDGVLDIESAPGNGTVLRASIPVKQLQ